MFIKTWLLILCIVIVILLIYFIYYFGKKIGILKTNRYWESQIEKIKEASTNQSRSVIKGQVAEQFAPYLPDFPFKPTDCKFIGKPVDFIVFENLDSAEKTKITLVEFKTGQSTLNKHERSIKQAIENKNIFWYEYRLK